MTCAKFDIFIYHACCWCTHFSRSPQPVDAFQRMIGELLQTEITVENNFNITCVPSVTILVGQVAVNSVTAICGWSLAINRIYLC